jgi:hypothetical protein
VGGHEYAETITDPDPFTGWRDENDKISDGGSPGEIADKCEWGGSIYGLKLAKGDVKLSTGSFAMQSLWSNAAGGCVLTSAPKVTVKNPGNQKTTLGSEVSLQIQATTNTGLPLSFTASGLPPGLSITSAGLISGEPDTTAGAWLPKVTASNAQAQASVAFIWQASSAAGQVQGYDSKCADDFEAGTSSGNKIDIWTCDGEAEQSITFAADGELKLEGGCVTAKTGAVLDPCTGAADQVWTRKASGEYVVKSDSHCLTDPKDSKTNGTQLTIPACTNDANQHWSLP